MYVCKSPYIKNHCLFWNSSVTDLKRASYVTQLNHASMRCKVKRNLRPYRNMFGDYFQFLLPHAFLTSGKSNIFMHLINTMTAMKQYHKKNTTQNLILQNENLITETKLDSVKLKLYCQKQIIAELPHTAHTVVTANLSMRV